MRKEKDERRKRMKCPECGWSLVEVAETPDGVGSNFVYYGCQNGVCESGSRFELRSDVGQLVLAWLQAFPNATIEEKWQKILDSEEVVADGT